MPIELFFFFFGLFFLPLPQVRRRAAPTRVHLTPSGPITTSELTVHRVHCLSVSICLSRVCGVPLSVYLSISHSCVLSFLVWVRVCFIGFVFRSVLVFFFFLLFVLIFGVFSFFFLGASMCLSLLFHVYVCVFVFVFKSASTCLFWCFCNNIYIYIYI